VRAVRRLLASIDFPTAVDAGVKPEHLDDLVPLAHGEYFMTIDPHRWSQEDVRRAYEDALALAAR
jgi:alcohol dehydrogenase class IV